MALVTACSSFHVPDRLSYEMLSLQGIPLTFSRTMSLTQQQHYEEVSIQLPDPSSLQPHDDPQTPPFAFRESHHSSQQSSFAPDRSWDSKARPASGGEPPPYILCIPLQNLSPPMQFGACVGGVLFFYLLYGYSQVCEHAWIWLQPFSAHLESRVLLP
jgi:hypothetical protein